MWLVVRITTTAAVLFVVQQSASSNIAALSRQLAAMAEGLPPADSDPAALRTHALGAMAIAVAFWFPWLSLLSGFFRLVAHIFRVVPTVSAESRALRAFKRLTLVSRVLSRCLDVVRAQRARVVDGILRRESMKSSALFLERMRRRENLVVKVQRFVRARQQLQHTARTRVVQAAGLIRFSVPEAAQRGAWQEPAPWVRVRADRSAPTVAPGGEGGEAGTAEAAAAHVAAVAAHEEAMAETADVVGRWLVHDCRLGKPSVAATPAVLPSELGPRHSLVHTYASTRGCLHPLPHPPVPTSAYTHTSTRTCDHLSR